MTARLRQAHLRWLVQALAPPPEEDPELYGWPGPETELEYRTRLAEGEDALAEEEERASEWEDC